MLESLQAEVVRRVRLEHNVTMAGSDLVLARPVWDPPLDGGASAAQVR
jgi:hypothetical protein